MKKNIAFSAQELVQLKNSLQYYIPQRDLDLTPVDKHINHRVIRNMLTNKINKLLAEMLAGTEPKYDDDLVVDENGWPDSL